MLTDTRYWQKERKRAIGGYGSANTIIVYLYEWYTCIVVILYTGEQKGKHLKNCKKLSGKTIAFYGALWIEVLFCTDDLSTGLPDVWK